LKVLVTGATGYLGPVAAAALAAQEHEVVGLARSQRSANALRGHGIDLAAIRKATGLTQVELAAKLGVGQAAVSKIERQSEMLGAGSKSLGHKISFDLGRRCLSAPRSTSADSPCRLVAAAFAPRENISARPAPSHPWNP
jgi:NAD(P)-dependent dehydrogenase (short-subunit alcohol dehydrogenase family)